MFKKQYPKYTYYFHKTVFRCAFLLEKLPVLSEERNFWDLFLAVVRNLYFLYLFYISLPVQSINKGFVYIIETFIYINEAFVFINGILVYKSYRIAVKTYN